ncbi:MAG: DNA-directed RNA polymerase subunit N [Candidatus Aenigmarchaeota archaeon]|nr:DNA-directed RNA polymerase subunit N [Candidatus Aenigmarchaeota archaeon]
MMIPVRCFTCGKIIGHAWEEYQRRVAQGEDPAKVMTEMGLKRYCCRQVFLGNVDMLKEISQFRP